MSQKVRFEMSGEFVLFGTVKPQGGRLYVDFGCPGCDRSHDSSEIIFYSHRKKLIIFLACCEFTGRDFVVIGNDEPDAHSQPPVVPAGIPPNPSHETSGCLEEFADTER
jgi:hypothetical protein